MDALFPTDPTKRPWRSLVISADLDGVLCALLVQHVYPTADAPINGLVLHNATGLEILWRRGICADQEFSQVLGLDLDWLIDRPCIGQHVLSLDSNPAPRHPLSFNPNHDLGADPKNITEKYPASTALYLWAYFVERFPQRFAEDRLPLGLWARLLLADSFWSSCQRYSENVTRWLSLFPGSAARQYFPPPLDSPELWQEFLSLGGSALVARWSNDERRWSLWQEPAFQVPSQRIPAQLATFDGWFAEMAKQTRLTCCLSPNAQAEWDVLCCTHNLRVKIRTSATVDANPNALPVFQHHLCSYLQKVGAVAYALVGQGEMRVALWDARGILYRRLSPALRHLFPETAHLDSRT